VSLQAPIQVQKLQQTLHAKAKESPDFRFYALYDKIYREDILAHAYRLARHNGGKPGVDGENFSAIEAYGVERWLGELAQALREKRYRASPVRRVYIPKPDGKQRPLGIPTIRDRVVQTAAVLVLAPIFEADLQPEQYAYREGRNAHDAVRHVHKLLNTGYTDVIDADLTGYFDSIPHAELLQSVARRISDRHVLALIKQWLVVPVEEDDGRGRRIRTTVAKDTKRGIPQGAPISPLLSNLYMRRFLLGWKTLGLEARLQARIVNFADDCAPRRRVGGRKPSVQPCCTRDGGRPPEAAVQAEASNHPLLLPLREVVVSELGKGRARPGQVRTVESNVSEPLMTCRKRRDDVETGEESLPRDESGGDLSTAQAASGIKAARLRSRLLCGTWEPVTPMLREPRKGKPPECVSTEAGYRGGATRSSAEGPVMGLERRGCPIRPEACKQPRVGGLA